MPFDDPRTFDMISAAKTLGVFQIESPGQRELVGKSGIENFSDIITDISLFRPGPVKSDMITPYLEVKQGWKQASYLHDDLRPILERHPRRGGLPRAGDRDDRPVRRHAPMPRATSGGARSATRTGWPRRRPGSTRARSARGYPLPVVEQIWKVIEAFASFGFCKAHAAAFALPTYQSAWLKAHYPAHFISGVLTHDPGMYPKRLILDDARQLGIAVLGLDVNASEAEYVVEKLADATPAPRSERPRSRPASAGSSPGAGSTRKLPAAGEGDQEQSRLDGPRLGHPDRAGGGARHQRRRGAAGSSRARDGAPYASLTDFWQRAQVSRPVVERLVQAGAFDSVYGIGTTAGTGRRHRVTRRDLLLEIGDLDRLQRASSRASKGRARGLPRSRPGVGASPGTPRCSSPSTSGATDAQQVSGLPEMTDSDRVRAELDILGLDASRHVVDFHAPLPRPARDHPLGRPALGAQPQRAAGGRGEGGHPDPADPVGPPGHLPDPRRRHRPGRRDLLRGRAGSLCRHGLRLLAAGRAR